MKSPARNSSILRASLPGPKICIVLLLLGVVINVLVAWGCAISHNVLYGNMAVHPSTSEIEWWRANAANQGKATPPKWVERVSGIGVHGISMPPLAQVTADNPSGTSYMSAGLPFPSLDLGWNDASSRGCWFVWIWGFANPSLLPVDPMWFGFIVDSLVYFALLLSAVLAFDFWRMKRRLERGLCPVCKYPIGVSAVCTECGSAIIQTKKA